MKKTIFILAALFAATFANAQITYERTINFPLQVGGGVEMIGIELYQTKSYDVPGNAFGVVGEYIFDIQQTDEAHFTYSLLDANTLSVVKSFNQSSPIFSDLGNVYFITLLSQGIFTTDGKWACIRGKGTEATVITEDGNTIATLPWENSGAYFPFLLKTKTTYKLVVPRHYTGTYTYDIYSVPGNGDSSQDVSAPVVPRNARKVLKKDQVFVENADKTYTLQGQEVK
jgi:hypothetical protein